MQIKVLEKGFLLAFCWMCFRGKRVQMITAETEKVHSEVCVLDTV